MSSERKGDNKLPQATKMTKIIFLGETNHILSLWARIIFV